MEVLPSKFRSPPPKPPRRRSAEQLAVSPTGTFPSTKKKYLDQNRLCLQDDQQNIEDHTRCESLPASWIDDLSYDQNKECTMLIRNVPLSSSARFKSTHIKLQVPDTSLENKTNLPTRNFLEQSFKENALSLWTKRNDTSYECISKPNIFSSFVKSVPEDFYYNKGSSCNLDISGKNKLDIKAFPKDNHRRHHSDPVLSILDQSNTRLALQKYVLRSHSFLSGSKDNKLGNSVTMSFKSKNHEYLHEEMKHLKDVNNKLWQHLCSIQACLDKVTKNCEETPTSLSVSDLLSSLYSSQKAKDDAMEDRIKIIMEERDIAIQELEDVVQIIAKSFGNDTILEEEKFSEKEIKEILTEIEYTYNPSKLLQQQRLLLTYLYRSKELKQDRIMHELKLVVKERDHLQEKVKYMEEELKSQQACIYSDVLNMDNKHWENNLLKILCQVIQQRDIALLQVNSIPKLENKSFRHDGINNTVKRSLQTSYHDHKCDQFSVDPTSDEIRLLKGEILFLSKALEKETSKRESVEEKCYRLERLITVLRKKINGQNVGIPV
ncbi:hypothetical protein JTE90_025726 [Oedothorax gibbosus]|uniref:Uncharacterized protein n=1 Tax=Oedothorax gibbosus TaxID=931172 RepID=A0AAV6U495_9ARAC|nr:hypothetical protein JTE90_025726 [Oedothorax gibbosus]